MGLRRYVVVASVLLVIVLAALYTIYLAKTPTLSTQPSTATSLTSERRVVEIIDALSRRVEVRVPVERVVLLYGLEDWVAVGGEDALRKLVALNSWRYRKWRPDWWQKWVEYYPWLAELPDTGQPCRNFNVEVVVRVKPDVVIATPWMYKCMVESGDLERLRKANIPVIVIDFVPQTTNVTEHLEIVSRSIMAMGKLLGREDRARELIDFYKRQVFLVLDRLKNVEKRPRVVVFATWAKWRVYGEKGIYNVWITLAKGVNIGAKVVKGSSGDVTPEYILKENPDVIIFTCNNNFPEGQRVVVGFTVNDTSKAKEVLEELIRRPGWSSLKAVRSKRVYLIHHGLSHGHIFQFACLQYIAKWLHPELFRDLDPLENLKLFYDKFMPYPLEGVWAVGLADP